MMSLCIIIKKFGCVTVTLVSLICIFLCRQIALPVDAFDSKQRLLTALRDSFPCGTLTLTSVATNSLVNQYWEQLRTRYLRNVNEGISNRICHLTDHYGWQSGKYWLLSSQVCFHMTEHLQLTVIILVYGTICYRLCLC